MSKLIASLSSKLDLTSKSQDNFNLTVEISQEDNTSISFNDSSTLNLGSIADEVLIFVVYSNDYEPLLAASNIPLEINSAIPLYKKTTLAVASFLSQYAGNNTFEEEILNYYTNVEPDSNILTGPAGIIENSYLSKFYKKSILEEGAIISPSASISESNIGNNYISGGVIIGTNPITVSISSNDFKIPKGTYKYELKQLSTIKSADISLATSSLSNKLVYLNSTTWLQGKFKVKN